MTLWQAIREKLIFALTARPNDPDRVRYIRVPARHAGIYVDEDVAMKYSAFYRGVAYIAQQVAGLPWEVIRETQDKTTKLPTHPVWSLIRKSPNPEMGAFTWRETMLAWAVSWGNGYSEIEVDGFNRPVALWPISPDRVEVKRLNGEIVYRVNNYGTKESTIPAERMFHLHGLGFDGLQGYSLISLAARSIGLSIAAEEYASDFFANGAVSNGAYKMPGEISQEAYDRLKADIQENRSKFGEKWKPPLLEGGMDWVDMSIPADDAQLLETRQFQIADIARWLGLPPHKLADLSRATFTNIESQSREVVNDAFMPWIHRLEEEADRKLFSGRERGIRTKINVRGLLRGDDSSRAVYYQIMRNIGVYSTNDVRRLEDMDPVGPEGDELLVQLNQTTLRRLVDGQPQPTNETVPDAAQLRQNYAMIVEDDFRRILRREANRFEQSRHKFTDAVAFAEWKASLRQQQKEYAEETLRPVVTSLILMADSAANIVDVLPVLRSSISAHLDRSDLVFDEMKAGKLAEFEVEMRAKQEARDLIERIFAVFLEKTA